MNVTAFLIRGNVNARNHGATLFTQQLSHWNSRQSSKWCQFEKVEVSELSVFMIAPLQ